MRLFLFGFVLLSFNLVPPVFAQEQPQLEAEEVIPYLIGHWRFEYGTRTGGRIYTPLFAEKSAEIQEYFDELPFLGKGLIQLSLDGTFSNTLFFNNGDNDFLTGEFDRESQTISYRSLKVGNENLRFEFEIIDPDHFRYTNYQTENGEEKAFFSAKFTRVKSE